VLSVLPIGFTDLRKTMLGVLGQKDATDQQKQDAHKARLISVPVRIHGPLDSPKFDVQLDLFGARTKDFDPGKAIQGVGDLLGDIFNRNKKKNEKNGK
jgi:hypothetical protein